MTYAQFDAHDAYYRAEEAKAAALAALRVARTAYENGEIEIGALMAADTNYMESSSLVLARRSALQA